MKCSEIMKTEVECCGTEESVGAVAKRMRERNIGFLPVCDEKGAVIGTVTDRDLAIRVIAEERPPESTSVHDVMTPELVCCAPEEELDVAEELMSRFKKSRILCVDARRHAVGVISLSDIAQVEAAEKTSRVLEAVSAREVHL